MSEIKVAVAKINFIKWFHVLKLLKSSQALPTSDYLFSKFINYILFIYLFILLKTC